MFNNQLLNSHDISAASDDYLPFLNSSTAAFAENSINKQLDEGLSDSEQYDQVDPEKFLVKGQPGKNHEESGNMESLLANQDSEEYINRNPTVQFMSYDCV